jgi:hypothetical protein
MAIKLKIDPLQRNLARSFWMGRAQLASWLAIKPASGWQVTDGLLNQLMVDG